MIKARSALYLGNKWVLLGCTLVFFPVAVLLFMRHAVWVEQEIGPDELAALRKASD